MMFKGNRLTNEFDNYIRYVLLFDYNASTPFSFGLYLALSEISVPYPVAQAEQRPRGGAVRD